MDSGTAPFCKLTCGGGGFLDERGRRLFAANEALALGRGGVTAVSAASGIARSTINRGIAELRAGSNELGEGVRRRGGGRKSAVVLQPGLLSALEELIEGAIRGDPQSPLRWVSRSQRNIATALRQQGFAVSQKLVGLLLRELDYSCQANRKTREGTQHPDRNAQFEYINARVKAALAAGQPAISVDTKKKACLSGYYPHPQHVGCCPATGQVVAEAARPTCRVFGWTPDRQTKTIRSAACASAP